MTVKKEQSNFVKTMQGFNSQALRLQMSLKRQNMMLFDVYTVLQRRQKASDSILAEATNLQATVQNHLGPESTASSSHPVSKSNVIGADHAETATLRIALSRSREEVVLYKGQCIRTPMGEASVLSIMPGVEKVVLQLSFGRMYVTVRQMVVWGRDKRLNQLDELLAVDSLRQRWTALHSTGGLFVPSDIRNAIQDLAGQGEDEPATDGDEDSANDDTNTVDAIDEINSILELKRNGTLAEACSEQSALPMQVEQASSSAASASASACNGTSSVCIPSSTARCAAENPSWGDYTFPLKGYSSEATSTSISSATSSSSSSSSAAGPLSRQALKNILSLQGIEDCQDLSASSALPYILSPPGTAFNFSFFHLFDRYHSFVTLLSTECVCPVLSCAVLSCPVLSCPVLSCPVLSCPVLSCPVLSCPVPYRTYTYLSYIAYHVHELEIGSCDKFCYVTDTS
jgi:hypothetical protein